MGEFPAGIFSSSLPTNQCLSVTNLILIILDMLPYCCPKITALKIHLDLGLLKNALISKVILSAPASDSQPC